MNQLIIRGKIIRGVIFDMDGTLLDTEKYHLIAWNKVLKPFGIIISPAKYEDWVGKNGDIIEQELIQEHHLNIKKNEILFQKEKMVSEMFSSMKLDLLPFAKETILFFKNHSLPVAVASSSPMEELHTKLKRTGLDQLFDAIVSSEEVKRGKPYPEIYLEAAKRLHVSCEDCIAIEDTIPGTQAALAAGCISFAVPNEFTQKKVFDNRVTVFKNLEACVQSINK